MLNVSVMSRWEKLCGAAYAGGLLWINAYVCRTWLFHPTAQMNSLHGFLAALVRMGDGWLHPAWWPFWDCGIPFEFTHAPLVPVTAAALAAWRSLPPEMALQAVSAIFYCAAPVSLFVMAWLLTRAPGYSFFAGLFYSLLAPSEILAPDGLFSWAHFLDPQRFMLQAVWNETPRCAALAFLLLFILMLVRSIEKRRPVYYVAAAVCVSLAMLATPFAGMAAALSTLCLLTVLRRESWRANVVLTVGIGAFAYAWAAPFLPPSLWLGMGAASAANETWTMGSFTALAAVVVAWLALTRYLPRWSQDWRLQFFALFAYAMSCAPILAVWLDRQFLPQPSRYRIEMDAALALLVVFGLRPWVERLPQSVKAVTVLVILSLAGEQVVRHRILAKVVLQPADVRKTIEYRTAQRVARDLPGVRVMLPGSLSHWANAFTEVPQFSGSSGITVYNQTQQRAVKAVYRGGETAQEDARVSLAWLKAYGVGAVVVSGPRSREFWKPFGHPEKFDGVLPALWTDEGVTAYHVPQRTPSLAHVVPESGLVRRAPCRAGDTAELDRYNAALDDPALPEATFEWQGRNRIQLRAFTAPGQAISVQISGHPGWHAAINGRPVTVHRDGLGMIWLRPDQAGPTTVEMHYDGGWELRLCWGLSLAGMLAAGFCLARGGIR